jgi:hypothetical protein
MPVFAGIEKKINLKIHIEELKTLNSKINPEGKEQRQRYHITRLHIKLQRHRITKQHGADGETDTKTNVTE